MSLNNNGANNCPNLFCQGNKAHHFSEESLTIMESHQLASKSLTAKKDDVFLKQHILTSWRFRQVKARILFLVRQVSVYVKYLHMLWKNLKLINREDSSVNAKSLLIGKEGHLMCFNPDSFNNEPIKKIEDENLRIGFLSWLFSPLTIGTIN